MTRSDSRSTASSASPPDRTVSDSSSGVHSAYGTTNAMGNPTPQNHSKAETNCHCEGDRCYVEHSVVYGQISRRNSIRLKSPTHPIYETSAAAHGKNPCSIYESRMAHAPVAVPPPSVPENPYGDNCNLKKLVNLAGASGTAAASVTCSENGNLSSYGVNQWKSCSLNRDQCMSPDCSSSMGARQQNNGSRPGDDPSNTNINGGEKPEKNEVMIRRKPSLTRPKTTDMSPVIQSTPYGRCTNMKMSSFIDQSMPPIPPPLPPLSFVTSLNTSGQHGTVPIPVNNSPRGLHSSGSFRASPRIINHSPANYLSPQYPRHSTIPNHPATTNGGSDGLSTFHGINNTSSIPTAMNTYPLVQASPGVYNHSSVTMLQNKN